MLTIIILSQMLQINSLKCTNIYYYLNRTTSANKSEVWVKKWVDYSSKYGLGYLLSNGSSGVFFNDSTKIVLNPKAKFAFNNFN